jgi:hypothetical protein
LPIGHNWNYQGWNYQGTLPLLPIGRHNSSFCRFCPLALFPGRGGGGGGGLTSCLARPLRSLHVPTPTRFCLPSSPLLAHGICEHVGPVDPATTELKALHTCTHTSSYPLSLSPSFPLALLPSYPLALSPFYPLALLPSCPLALSPSIPLAHIANLPPYPVAHRPNCPLPK